MIYVDLKYYSILVVQPINYDKTKAMWSTRAIGHPNSMPVLKHGDDIVNWPKKYKNLDYWITNKRGSSTLIDESLMRIRERTTSLVSIKSVELWSWSVRRNLLCRLLHCYLPGCVLSFCSSHYHQKQNFQSGTLPTLETREELYNTASREFWSLPIDYAFWAFNCRYRSLFLSFLLMCFFLSIKEEFMMVSL